MDSAFSLDFFYIIKITEFEKGCSLNFVQKHQILANESIINFFVQVNLMNLLSIFHPCKIGFLNEVAS